jgi:ATP-dependent helicase HrpA
VELWERAPRAQHERKNLRTWDFDALPASVTIDVGGRKMLAYPALVDVESGVDLKLLESPAAAAASSRDGLRRLFLLNSGTTSISKLEATLTPALASQKRALVLRALDEAFETTSMPASRGAFADRLATGRVRLPDVLGDLVRVALDLFTELERARGLLKPLASRPGVTRASVEDIQAQLAELIPTDLMRTTPTARLAHITRYLKAVTVRLQRLSHDPLKDQQKATQVTPFVRRYQQLPATATSDRDELRWLVEELRVQVFAPELKTAVPISPQRLQDAFARLGR